jgi:ferric-dicitrate binding protein FerR (iron transport regulator)
VSPIRQLKSKLFTDEMSKHVEIWTRISRTVAGEHTQTDDREVDRWLKEKPQNRQIFQILKEMWQYNQPRPAAVPPHFDLLLRRIHIQQHLAPKPFYRTTLFKAAAMLLLIIGSNLLFYKYGRHTGPDQSAWHEISVPPGNRTKMILPDSTVIWLNNQTRLRYAEDFLNNRKVELSGEAYFDVHHDAKHPFEVIVGYQKITVLGTRFSVNAYPDDQEIETSLISGSVVFDPGRSMGNRSLIKLEPGYRLIFNKEKQTIQDEKIESSFYDYWEKGIYAFKDERFDNLAVKIKHLFNVELIFEDKLLEQKMFTGTINVNDNIYVFMEAIRRTSAEPIEYTFNKNKIFIKIKRKAKT